MRWSSVRAGMRPVGQAVKGLGRGLSGLLLALQGVQYGYLRRRTNAGKAPLRLYWWDGVPNFGDCFTRDLIPKLFGYRVEWTPLPKSEIITAGSILDVPEMTTDGSGIHVWGSGFIRPHSKEPTGAAYHMVRGKLTRSRVAKGGRPLPMGDPGLLANLIYPRGRPNGKIGVVSHYLDRDQAIVKEMSRDGRFLMIDVGSEPRAVARAISSCTLVLSSSLHGLVFADSFGIPNIHVILSDRLTGGDYKYRDYYSAIGKHDGVATNARLFDDDYLDLLRRTYVPIDNLPRIQRAMVAAFPFD